MTDIKIAMEAAHRIDDPETPTCTAGFIADAVTVARTLLALAAEAGFYDDQDA